MFSEAGTICLQRPLTAATLVTKIWKEGVARLREVFGASFLSSTRAATRLTVFRTGETGSLGAPLGMLTNLRLN